MAKFKYTIQVGKTTITRTSARRYSHVVVGAGLKEAAVRKGHADAIKYAKATLIRYREEVANGYPDTREHEIMCQGLFGGKGYDPKNADSARRMAERMAEAEKNYAQWIAELKKQIANDAADLEAYLASQKARTVDLFGFCGRDDLAQKLAAKESVDHENVQVIAITPEMIREIKPRAKKEAA
jgi:hypothetical protein